MVSELMQTQGSWEWQERSDPESAVRNINKRTVEGALGIRMGKQDNDCSVLRPGGRA